MRSVVIIPTLGRSGLADRLLAHLEKQSRRPDEVVVSTSDDAEPSQATSRHFKVTHIRGSKGLCAQRNRALEYALPRSDIVTFFDDDFLPSNHYLEELLEVFQAQPGWAAIMGDVIRDGAQGAGLTFEEGLAHLETAAQVRPPPDVVLHPGLYGCNMSFRSRDIGQTRFDERLALYGWQEDIDFSSRLRSHGLLVSLKSLTGVHLGFKSGRVSGYRLGYSQIVNPIYLLLKGTMSARFACGLMARNLAANAVRSVRPESYIDRRGRLRGNLLGLLHVMTGRVEPEHITRL